MVMNTFSLQISRLLVLSFILLLGCQSDAPEKSTSSESTKEEVRTVDFPSWAQDATIYEVNVRQYTKEGTLNAFAEHLPRLKELGVKILWFMPIHPISVKKRKGVLGSYYAVQDYKAVNPDLGTDLDFKEVINQAHELGLKVIMDWVPNHTGFDNDWIDEHPDWYEKNEEGEIIHPEGTDWYDVASLDYDVPEMRQAMIDAMLFWVENFDIDGFRCDVASEVPDLFWEEVSHQLAGTGKSLFMLAESDQAEHRNEGYFHANYGWHLHHLMNEIAKGIKNPYILQVYLAENQDRYHQGFHMHFTSNHDENCWKGSAPERFGKMIDVMNVFAFTFQGMPLIYCGQEANLDRKLAFFEKDEISWGDYSKAEFFKGLIQLKKDNKALWNDPYIVNTTIIEVSKTMAHYKRETADNRVDVILNFSDQPLSYLPSAEYKGKDYFTGEQLHFYPAQPLNVPANGYKVVIK